MAGDDGEQQAMTAERLAEILAANLRPKYRAAIESLLADNERLRAREAALMSHIDESLTDIAQSILESGGLPPELFPLDHARVTVASILRRLTQARALLASADERSGSDGQQPEQATCPVCGTPGRRVTSRWWCDGCNLPFRRPGEAAGEE